MRFIHLNCVWGKVLALLLIMLINACAAVRPGYIPQKMVERYEDLEARKLLNYSVQAKIERQKTVRVGQGQYENTLEYRSLWPKLKYIEVTGDADEKGNLPIVVHDRQSTIAKLGIAPGVVAAVFLFYGGYLVIRYLGATGPSESGDRPSDAEWNTALYGTAIPLGVSLAFMAVSFLFNPYESPPIRLDY